MPRCLLRINPFVMFSILLAGVLGTPIVSVAKSNRPASAKLPLYFPLSFEENRGQVADGVSYYSIGPAHQTFFMDDRIVIRPTLGPTDSAIPIQLRFKGGSAEVEPVGEDPLPTRSSYFLGSDSGRWKTGIRHFRRVRYRDLYPGIDLIFYGDGRNLEYDLIVAPGADPSQVRFSFEGADQLKLSPEGHIILSTSVGQLVHRAPKIYQARDASRKKIGGRATLSAEGTVGFRLDSYDPTLPLTIDPVLVYSTYLGGTRGDVIQGVAVDAEGNVYVAGSTGSLDFPLVDPLQDEFAGGGATIGDIFVSKIDPSGSYLVYSTYVGGDTTEVGRSLALDAAGQVYVTGTTFSSDFPSTAGSFQPECSGQCPFLFKLSADGSRLVYSTFLGRGDGTAVAVDADGQAILTGRTTSADFPVRNAFQPERGGLADAFAAKFNAAGADLIFSTLVGGSGEDNLDADDGGAAVDAAGNIYISGTTDSTDFPVANPVQVQNGGEEDAFLVKLNPQGGLVYSTYLGGSNDDTGQGVAADAAGNAHWIGSTVSDDFPVTPGALQTEPGGGNGDAFVVKIPPQGGALTFATYLGGPGRDNGVAVAVDGQGRIVAGGRAAAGYPTQDPFRPLVGVDAFVSKLTPDGSGLVYSVPLGGGSSETVLALATRGTTVYAAGDTVSPDFPILAALQPRTAGGTEAFLAQITDSGTLYFAQFGNGVAGGASAISEILLTNSSSESSSTATLELRDDDGDPLAVNLTVAGDTGGAVPAGPASMLEVTVPPLGLVRISTDGAGDLRTGSATVTFDNPLGGVIRFNLDPFGTAGVGESRLVRGFITPVRRTAINTGVAIFNPQESQVGIRMRLRDTDGEEIPGGLRTRAVPAGGHFAEFINQSFPSADLDDFVGTLTVEVTTLNALVAATALELGGQPGQFTTLPVTPLP